MKYLLDTHSLLWLATNSSNLSPHALSVISDTNNDGYFSLISLWELGFKSSIGKLILPDNPQKLEQRAVNEGLYVCPLTSKVISHVMMLPWYHKDPFDRIIVATAIKEGFVVQR